MMEWCTQLRTIPRKRAPQSTITYLEKSEMDALLNAPAQCTEQGRRDHALMIFLYNTGARADVAAQVKIEDLFLAHSSRDQSLVQVRGKGNKVPRCRLWPQTVAELSSLRASRPPTVHVHPKAKPRPQRHITSGATEESLCGPPHKIS